MSQKKAILRRFTGGPLSGYLPATGFVRAGLLEMLDLAGRVVAVPVGEVKMVSFVRDFNSSDQVNPERLLRKTFLARPRSEGLWVRMTLRDDDSLEGLAPLDLTLLDNAADDSGLQISPPDVRGNVQRIYVPRQAMTDLQVLAVVTTPSRKKTAPQEASAQEDLFSNLTSTRLH